jgi:hypothetical protein
MVPPAISQLVRSKSLPWLAAAAAFLLVSCIWVIGNFTRDPAYGDAREYWQLAHTLAVDSWRTLGYPLVLHAALLAHDATARLVLVYALQICASFGAIYYFLGSLDFAAHKRGGTRRNLLLAGLVTLTPPVAHFDQSILSDALASAGFILACAALLRLLTTSGRNLSIYVSAASGIVASGLLRQDRLLCLLLILLLLSAWLVWRLRFAEARVAVVLLAVALATSWFNHHTQTANLGRPAVSVPFMLFDRTTRGHLQALLPHMPAVIQARITPAEAAVWDSRQSYWPQIAAKLSDRAGQTAMLRGSMVSAKRAGISDSFHIIVENAQYMAAPWTYAAYTIWPSLPGAGPTLWTNIHITALHSLVGNLYLGLFVALLLVSTWLLLRSRTAHGLGRFTLGYLALVVAVCAVVNTLSSSLEFHIRYALPIFGIQCALLVWIVATSTAEHRQ